MTASPGLWVLCVLVLDFTVGSRLQLTPLLAAAPVIACTGVGSGRRQCVILGCGCALVALLPLPDEPDGLDQRAATALTILVVALASLLIVQRRIRLQRALEQVRRVADVAQRVLLHPVPERIGPVEAAVGYLAAAAGARIGGDFYEVIETPYGLRAILGDMRGNGLDAVGGAAALLGAFREAGAVETELAAVAARLDAALTRYAVSARAAEVGDCAPDLRSEDFATAVLVQVPLEVAVTATVPVLADGSSPAPASPSASCAELIVCGHPAPYVVRASGKVQLLTPEDPTPPLGMRILTSGPDVITSFTVELEPGESLVCYTDGITESRDRAGVFFPLTDVLADVCGHGDEQPGAIADKVRRDLVAHTKGTLHDDAAVLVLRRLGTCGL